MVIKQQIMEQFLQPILNVPQQFWKDWQNYREQIKNQEPPCTCEAKHPETANHFIPCPYRKFWNNEFRKFLTEWTPEDAIVQPIR